METYTFYLKEHGPDAAYKAKLAVKYWDAGDGGKLALPDTDKTKVVIRAETDGKAYKQLLAAYKPGDQRKVAAKKFVPLFVNDAYGIVYRFCDKHDEPYSHGENAPDEGCIGCIADKIERAYAAEKKEAYAYTAGVIGCTSEKAELNGWTIDHASGAVGCCNCGTRITDSLEKMAGRKKCSFCNKKLMGTNFTRSTGAGN